VYTHLLPGAELPLVESFGLLNDLFPFPSILDAGYPGLDLYIYIKAIPLQAWTCPVGSRRLRLPDFKTIGT
jgi:hypothetical protein